jgi:hypothetical protein
VAETKRGGGQGRGGDGAMTRRGAWRGGRRSAASLMPGAQQG